MFENITEVIGFDLGHGETALAHVFVNDSDKRSEPELLEIFGNKKNAITAIGYHPRRGTLIGRPALKTKGIEKSSIAFKRKPSSDPEYQRVMNDYIRKIYETQIEQGRINENESFFIVGCPSEWTKDLDAVSAYEQLFLNAGIQRVKVVAESRAAYIHAVEKSMLTTAVSKKGLIVIDIGSSTTDITFIDQNSNSIPIDVGRDLGAALIDKAIFKRVVNVCDDHREKAEMENIFSQKKYLYLRNECELACRDTKEAYFSDPENYQEPGDYAPYQSVKVSSGIRFEPEVDCSVMNEILDTPFVNLGSGFQTWPSAFMNELVRLKQELEVRPQFRNLDDFSGAILLTGGASRMNFVRQICEEVFPQASIKLDNTPEFCIARGLARWGRVEINTSQFSRDVEKFCSSNIKSRVASKIDPLYDSISAVLADKIIRIIKSNFNSWKNRNHFTINNMKSAIDSEIKHSLQENNLSKLFGKEIKQMLEQLSKELTNEIRALEGQYGILGKLGESFELKNITIGNLSFGSQPNIDATDGLISQFGSVVAWISGILAGVAAYLIGPIVLGIIVGLTALISTTLFSILFAFLITPAGWPVLATFGILVTFATLVGKKTKNVVKDAIEENLPSWDLPVWVRNKVKSDSVYSKIDEERQVIINQLTSKLKSEEKIRQELVEKITSIFETSLKAQANDMKALIR